MRMHTIFWLETLKGIDHLKDLSVDGKEDNIRMDLREVGWEGVDCIHLAQDGDRWRAPMSTVINILVP
jgi:hypothetical protein